jgi:serine/threonine-protein kinase
VFSAGSVLYELATNAAPFTAANEIDLIFAVREANPIPVRELNPDVPEDLGRIIEKSMSRSRSARYQSALEFRNALLTFLRGYNPAYRRNKLAQFMKRVWREEIERELRAMEDYVVDVSDAERADYGKNLIAAALGPDAPFSRFSPSPTRSNASGEEAGEVHQQKTEILEGAPQRGGPPPIPRSPTRNVRGTPSGQRRPDPPPRQRQRATDKIAHDPEDPIHHEKTVVSETPKRS